MDISDYMKERQVYFIEKGSKILKIKGMNEMVEFIKSLKEGDRITIYYVQAIQDIIGKGIKESE